MDNTENVHSSNKRYAKFRLVPNSQREGIRQRAQSQQVDKVSFDRNKRNEESW